MPCAQSEVTCQKVTGMILNVIVVSTYTYSQKGVNCKCARRVKALVQGAFAVVETSSRKLASQQRAIVSITVAESNA